MSKLKTEASGCYSWSNGPGDRYCVDGSITFMLEREGRSLELKPGDRMVLPAGTVHSAHVGSSGCTCIEGHR